MGGRKENGESRRGGDGKKKKVRHERRGDISSGSGTTSGLSHEVCMLRKYLLFPSRLPLTLFSVHTRDRCSFACSLIQDDKGSAATVALFPAT